MKKIVLVVTGNNREFQRLAHEKIQAKILRITVTRVETETMTYIWMADPACMRGYSGVHAIEWWGSYLSRNDIAHFQDAANQVRTVV